MYQPPPTALAGRRRGVILLIVLVLLSLFAVVGLAFVLYAQSQATAARLARQAESLDAPDVAPDVLLSQFLSQLVFDVPDDESGVYSALRGHSLGRTMYGHNPDGTNDRAFNGVGRLHTYPQGTEHQTPFDSPPTHMNPFYLPQFQRPPPLDNPDADDYFLVNYTFFRDDPQVPAGLRFLRDPERLNPNPNSGPPAGWWPGGRAQPPWRTDPTQPRGPYTGGANAPYTYPDLNNLFLAAVRADGTVLTPSFHRDWLFRHPSSSWPSGTSTVASASLTSLHRGNPHWTTPEGKYLLLRPRPHDHRGPNSGTSAFPYPEDDHGDVKNLIGFPGGNDSLWLDLNAPVLTLRDGRRFKPLFAPLILDLDNRINLNVVGNALAAGSTHASNRGWGPWEINPARVLDGPGNETGHFLVGKSASGPFGRYGPDRQPAAGGLTASPGTPHFYARVDLDGVDELGGGAGTGLIQLPAAGSFSCFPSYPAGYGDGSAAERRSHPALYDLFRRTGDDVRFAASSLEALLRHGDTGAQALTSELWRLAPLNFSPPLNPTPQESAAARRRRNLVTLLSFDLDRPGALPSIWDPNEQPYSYAGGLAPVALGANSFPYLSDRYANSYPPGNLPAGSEFGRSGVPANDPRIEWRSRLVETPRLDVNRPLPDYPLPDARTGVLNLLDPATRRQFNAAQVARQGLARDLFLTLVTATGAPDPRDPGTLPSFADPALRWLAQLAVNLVDYLDGDDYLTPFHWGGDPVIWTATGAPPYPEEWVLGTELPRVVLNEACVQYLVGYENIWIELHNPFRTDPSLVEDVLGVRGAARLQVPGGHNAYRVVVARGIDDMTGAPSSILSVVSSFNPPAGRAPAADPRVLLPSNGASSVPNGSNRGFYVLGPAQPTGEAIDFPGPDSLGRPVATLATPALHVQLPAPVPPTLVLQRLACPQFPENDPTAPGYNPLVPYNPFVTIDCMASVPAYGEQSHGRVQPYAGANLPALRRLQLPPLVAPGDPLPPPPHHTFFRHNIRGGPGGLDPASPGQTLRMPFDWLVHLDRPVSSPLELVHVSACKPHQLTQRFCSVFTTRSLTGAGAGLVLVSAPTSGVSGGYPWKIEKDMQLTVDTGPRQETVSVLKVDENSFLAEFAQPHAAGFEIIGPQPHTHTAPWFSPMHRLYRVFEFLAVRGRAAGLAAPSTTAVEPTRGISPAQPLPGTYTITPAAMHGLSPSGVPWSIHPGDVLVIDTGTSQENIVVRSTTATTFTAQFQQAHLPGFTITHTRMGDRIPGKININTIWDAETLQALCDPQPGNCFTATDVDAIFRDLISSSNQRARTQGPGGKPSPGDRPFLSLTTVFTQAAANSQFPDGLDLTDTLFRLGSSGAPLFEVSSASHPYQRHELLTKIFNHLTTRSNVFAVWLTVGFFEVLDEQVRPVRLGAELGRAEGRPIRHRMFALVDRTNLVKQADAALLAAYPPGTGSVPRGALPAQVTRLTAPVAASVNTGTVAVASLAGATTISNPVDGTPALSTQWRIRPGTALVLEQGTAREETVWVSAVDASTSPPTITTVFTRDHPADAAVTIHFFRGNPGPQPNFDPRANNSLVPFFSIID